MAKIKDPVSFVMLLTVIMAAFFSTSIDSKNILAASNTNWQSVYTDEGAMESFVYYVKYGNLSIAKNKNTIYVKNSTVNISKKIKTDYSVYGGVLTNGKDIIYQKEKNIYLWKGIKKTVKLCSLKKKSDILIARYGNDVYFGRYIDYDDFQIYKYNLKNKKTVKTQYYNGYYSNGKYLFVNGQFHEGVSTPLILYNIKTGKATTITKQGSFANAAIISGDYVYYLKFNDSKWTWKILQYNLQSNKKKTLSKSLDSRPVWLDKNYCYYSDDEKGTHIYDIRNKRPILMGDTICEK